MFRKFVFSTSMVVGLMAFGAQAADLTVVSWGGAYQDAQRKVFFGPFKKATGTDLAEESWDGGIGVLRSRASSADPGWDVIQVETSDILLGCEEGLFESIDWQKLGGKDVYIPGAAEECGVGAILYNEGIAYDRDKLKTVPTGWTDFFDVAKFPGKRALRLAPNVALPGALLADGVKPEDVYKVLSTKEGVDRAFAKLDAIKNDLVFWKAGAQPAQLLASGEVVMTTAYNGRIDAANRTDKRNFAFVWNGSMQTFDYWVMLKGSPRRDKGYEFLNYINQPENQAKLPDEIAYGVVRKEASASIKPERLVDIPSNPKNLEVSIPPNSEFWLENNDRLTERLQAWSAK
ncbi:ABC transporter substrate-binding protein [Agrobacterium rhizogenes]|uniref:ABC transporter substrate-binding protein n=1 Tax=Rhizobium rhizogenes TaxID=359 RepID=UPI0022B69AED|nr:ABC transporter substrate-binding protein [Rhizobium rhizogenes]MCZ7450886.1 ABC transporter substrate-binding protein [Rhizobium rhizogenes]